MTRLVESEPHENTEEQGAKGDYNSVSPQTATVPTAAAPESLTTHFLDIETNRSCTCGTTHINCMTAKDWMKSQIGVWQVAYEGRDIRDKTQHPATFPIQLARKVMELFSHKGELVLDPFVGSGTTLVAAQDAERNAVGFDLQQTYIDLCLRRLGPDILFARATKQLAIRDDALHIPAYLPEESVKLIWTSPPYANLLNRVRKNKSRRVRVRDNGQLDKVEQYS